ncbi:myosin, putative, partial [Ichthyophthirius multifiliis]
GESGSGKTVNTKHCMYFLTSISQKETEQNNVSLEQKIISCNPILESFGNAKTIRNDNSSRFGKYIKLIIDKKTEKIIGAQTQSYLLEKSRITYQSLNERNYHIFYCLLKCGNNQLLENIYLKNPNQNFEMSHFQYITKSNCFSLKSLDDNTLFIEIKQSFKILNIQNDLFIWKIIASILLLGNIDFDESTYDNDIPCLIIEDNISSIAKIAKLLNVNEQTLKKGLLYKTRQVGKQVFDTPQNRMDANQSLHSLSKYLYEKLFLWLIFVMNTQLMQSGYCEKSHLCIGILDIFGFEVLAVNSFEQLCINYANEILQQLYIQYVFKSEQIEFQEQDLESEIHKIDFNDNYQVIDLLDKYPVGIFNLIDENSQIATTDDKLINKIKDIHIKNSFFKSPKIGREIFTICHTPREVDYNVLGFRSKNKDDLNVTLINMLSDSKDNNIKNIYEKQYTIQQNNNENINQKQQSDKFLGAKFRTQIQELIYNLKKSDVHFIRCIKPNEEKQFFQFNQQLVLQQLRYLGVLDTIKISKNGYPIRISFVEFYKQFYLIDLRSKSYVECLQENCDFKQLVQGLQLWNQIDGNNHQNKSQYLFGKSKVFIKNDYYQVLEDLYIERIQFVVNKCIIIQSNFKGYIQRKKYQQYVSKLKHYIRWFICKYEYKLFLKKRKSAQKIQRYYRKYILYKKKKYATFVQKYIQRAYHILNFQNMKNQLVKIQRFAKKSICRNKMKRYLTFKYNLILQSLSEGWIKILNFKTILIQKNIRGYLCRQITHRDIQKYLNEYRIKRIRQQQIIKIQNAVRRYLRKKRLQLLNLSAQKIQGFVKSVWLSQLLKKIRKAAIIIQIYFKRYMQQNQIQRKFMQQQNQMLKRTQQLEQACVFTSKMILTEQTNNTSFDSIEARIARDNLMLQDKQIRFFILLLDFNILTDISEIYEPLSWNQQYALLQKELIQNAQDITYIQVGDAHTIASATNGKLYSWGWNDYGQIGVDCSNKPLQISWVENISRPCILTLGSNHSIVVDVENNMYSLGKNTCGQLGLGNANIIYEPERVDTIHLKNDEKIKIVKSKYEMNIIITDKGSAFVWPLLNQINIQEMHFANKIQIQNAVCGLNFQIFLANNGNLYSLGNNDQGQLGLGDFNQRFKNPQLLEYFINQGEKIQYIECGLKHVICKSFLNKIYTWGWGFKGQLGINNKNNQNLPQQVNIQNNKYKVMQVQASYSSTLVLLENQKILWWGTNNKIKNILTPQELNLSTLDKCMHNNDFYVVKIEASWSRTLSLTYLRIADCRTIQQNNIFKQKTINTLIQKYQDSYLNNIDVPFFGSNIFSNKHTHKGMYQQKRVGIKYPLKKNIIMMIPLNILQTIVSNEKQNNIIQKLFATISQESNRSYFFKDKEPIYDKKCTIVVRQYATLYFILVIDQDESELSTLDLIQVIVDGFDTLFENVCELDIVYFPDKINALLDEIIIGGHVIETKIQEILYVLQQVQENELKN